jgi:hypothetical protein
MALPKGTLDYVTFVVFTIDNALCAQSAAGDAPTVVQQCQRAGGSGNCYVYFSELMQESPLPKSNWFGRGVAC